LFTWCFFQKVETPVERTEDQKAELKKEKSIVLETVVTPAPTVPTAEPAEPDIKDVEQEGEVDDTILPVLVCDFFLFSLWWIDCSFRRLW